MIFQLQLCDFSLNTNRIPSWGLENLCFSLPVACYLYKMSTCIVIVMCASLQVTTSWVTVKSEFVGFAYVHICTYKSV